MTELSSGEFQNRTPEISISKDYGRGVVTVMRTTPEAIKHDEGTGEPVIPVLFAQGYGGDKTLPWYVSAFAKTGRETIGVAYTGKRKSNSAKLIDVEGISVKVPELENEKADDIIAAMDDMGIEQLDAVAESAGAIRLMIAVAKHPEKFRHINLVHPAALDNNGSIITHEHVLHHQIKSVLNPRLLSERFRRKRTRWNLDEERISSEKGFHGMRAEQETVARSRLHSLIPELVAAHPHLRFSMVGDKDDANFRAKRLQEINGANLFEFFTSRWGGHGIGHRQDRVDEIDNMLVRMETGVQ